MQALGKLVGIEGRTHGQAQHALDLPHEARRPHQRLGGLGGEQARRGQGLEGGLGAAGEDLGMTARMTKLKVLGDELQVDQTAAQVFDAPY